MYFLSPGQWAFFSLGLKIRGSFDQKGPAQMRRAFFDGCLFGIFERDFGVQHALDTGDPVVVTEVDGFDALGAAAAGAVSYD